MQRWLIEHFEQQPNDLVECVLQIIVVWLLQREISKGLDEWAGIALPEVEVELLYHSPLQ